MSSNDDSARAAVGQPASVASGAGPTGAKADLRARMRRARAAIPLPERRARAAAVEERLFGLPEVRRARTVLLFYSFGTEVPTAAMAERFLEHGARLLLPYLDDHVMEAAEVRAGDSLVHTAYGPKEPPHRVAVDPREVDLVVTPGLAFDARGRRLGYGGGHYDRYLGRLGPEALRVGIGFDVQVIEQVPADELDRAVDLVVTDRRVIDCRNL